MTRNNFSRLLMVGVFMLALPLYFSPGKEHSGSPYQAIAVAGHSVYGGSYCDPCNNVDCICGPGESGGPMAATRQKDSQADSTAELGIILVVLLLWLRLKAQ